jgi:LysM repeat protein
VNQSAGAMDNGTPSGQPSQEKPETITFLSHKVTLGDTVAKLARRYKVSESELMLDNRLRQRSVIVEGQKIRIRDTRTSPKRKSLEYKIRPGDTLSALALQLERDAREIARENGIENPNLIRIGQVVLITPG